MATNPQYTSEFGGSSGPIQPEPHPLSAAELARLERAVNPASTTDTVQAARARMNGEEA